MSARLSIGTCQKACARALSDFLQTPSKRVLRRAIQEKRLSRLDGTIALDWNGATKAQRMSARNLFSTDCWKHFGVASNAIEPGDRIALISGFPRPVVLRPVGEARKLIGPAQAPGMMKGELWRRFRGDDLEQFEIV